MENVLNLELDKGLQLQMTKENQNIINQVSDAFSNAINKGIEKIDLSNEIKGLIKNEARKGELKSAGTKAVEAALRIGANAIGLKASTFNSGKQVLEALKEGDLKKGLSSAIDIGIDFIKAIPADAKKLIKTSKNLILGEGLDSELKNVMVKQKNTIDRIDKKCNKYEDALNKNDDKEMAKQIKSIKSDLDKVMLIEQTINRARSLVNQYELMNKKGDVKLTPVEFEVCQKIQ